MESLNTYGQRGWPDSPLSKITRYVYDAMDGKKGKDPDVIHADINLLARELHTHIIYACEHKSTTEKSEVINHIRSCLVVQRDFIFHHEASLSRGRIDSGYTRTLCSGLRRIEEDILHSWFVCCCKRIKVADRDAVVARSEIARKRLRMITPLRRLLEDESLSQTALQPLKQFHSRRNAAITVEELECIISYVAELERFLASQPVGSAGVVTGKRNRIDRQLLIVLKSSGYFTPEQLQQEMEESAGQEIPADPKTKRSVRLILNQTIAFVGALFRVFKETELIGNVNMAELRRLLVTIIQTPHAEQTTESSLDIAFRNISEPTRKNLILFLKKCIRWLESYKA